jgi:hypothetical protein
MALEIPKEDSGVIVTIKALTPAMFEKFVIALKNAPIISDPREMAAHISREVPSIALGRLASMLETMYTLYHIRELSGVRPARFLEDLIEALSERSELNLNPKDLPKFKAMLARLMSIEVLNTVSKAARLQRDGERLYCNAKILSDIRPVFSHDPTLRPLGAVLTHTLKIGFHEGGEHQEFHVVLDVDDLLALSEVIYRAQAKDKTLRKLLKESKLTSLDD